MHPKRKLSLILFVAAALLLVVTADVMAIVGRPLTPMSYAGVARRTTRRAVAVGATVGAAGAYYGSSCVQVVDAYGRVATRC